MESAEFKDWDVIKYNNSHILVHSCRDADTDALYDSGFDAIYLDEEKAWVCTWCGEVAPKEVALFAELCYCEKW